MAQRDKTRRAPKQDRAIRTRETILQAAGGLFDERGYAGTTIADITERAGITKGALYHHFSDKKALGTAVIKAQVEGMTSPPSSKLKVQELVDTGYFLAYQLRTDPIQRGASTLAMEQGPVDFDRMSSMDLWIEFVKSILTTAREQGELLDYVEIPRVAWLFVGAFAGMQNMSNAYTKRQDLTSRLSDLWEYLLPSIARPAILARVNIDPERGERIAGGLANAA
ncbi:ScbR family autoregulator-binding transcription factor [Streptomyces noursei]|uniref:ScbR family autoregulator-binding transcription factor n=1 Tax=Streptomyces noursei TaxID=1971 RepID=UPI003330D670